jgi:hypothetical protein
MKKKISIQRATNGNYIVKEADKPPVIYDSINLVILNEFIDIEILSLLQHDRANNVFEIEIKIKK